MNSFFIKKQNRFYTSNWLKLHYTLLTLMATACGTNPDVLVINETKSVSGEKGESGKNGTNGMDGINGTNGTNGTNGAAGTNGSNGSNGSNGAAGSNGINGTNGSNGHSAVTNLAAASSIQCPAGGTIIMTATDTNDNSILDGSDSNIQTAIICNGAAAPPSSMTPVAYIKPCGNINTPYSEVLLRLFDGSVLASFSENANGLNTRFSLIPDGNYQTTDSYHCAFSLYTSGNTRTISWSGGGSSWSM